MLTFVMTSLLFSIPINLVNPLPVTPSKPIALTQPALSLNLTTSHPLFLPLPPQHIPNTDLELFITPTSIFSYTNAITTLLNSAQRTISHLDPESLLLASPDGDQRFLHSIHNGLEIEVENYRPYKLTWGDVRDVVGGVREFCGERLCEFEVCLGSGVVIGVGRLGKERR